MQHTTGAHISLAQRILTQPKTELFCLVARGQFCSQLGLVDRCACTCSHNTYSVTVIGFCKHVRHVGVEGYKLHVCRKLGAKVLDPVVCVLWSVHDVIKKKHASAHTPKGVHRARRHRQRRIQEHRIRVVSSTCRLFVRCALLLSPASIFVNCPSLLFAISSWSSQPTHARPMESTTRMLAPAELKGTRMPCQRQPARTRTCTHDRGAGGTI